MCFVAEFCDHRAIYEGKDDYANMIEFASAIAEFCIADTKHPAFENRLVAFGGGDLVFISHMLGLGGTFSGNGSCCPWCEVPKRSIATTEAQTERTLERLFHLAHLPCPDALRTSGKPQFPFTCPACAMHFADQEVKTHRARLFLP